MIKLLKQRAFPGVFASKRPLMGDFAAHTANTADGWLNAC
jgi:hypothetical protein